MSDIPTEDTAKDVTSVKPSELPDPLFKFYYDNGIVNICHCGPGMYLGVNNDDNTQIATNCDKEDVSAQWDALESFEVYGSWKFRNRKTGKLLRLSPDGVITVDGEIASDNEKYCAFKIKVLGHSVKLESAQTPGQYIGVNSDSSLAPAEWNQFGQVSFQVIKVDEPKEQEFTPLYKGIGGIPENIFRWIEDQTVALCQCGPAMVWAVNSEDPIQIKTNVERDGNVAAQFDAEPEIEDQQITCQFRSRKTGKYLRMDESGVVTIDGVEDDKYTVFKIVINGHACKMLSNEVENQWLASNEDGSGLKGFNVPDDSVWQENAQFLTHQAILVTDIQDIEYEEEIEENDDDADDDEAEGEDDGNDGKSKKNKRKRKRLQRRKLRLGKKAAE